MRRLPFFFALLCGASAAQAGDKVIYAAAPTWVKPAPTLDLTATDANLLYDSQQRIEGATVTSYLDVAQRAVTAETLNGLGTLTFPWMPDKGDLIVHRVAILRGGEAIDVLKRGGKFSVIQREQGLEQRSLNGMLTATMPVEGLQVGDVLRITISITQADAALKGKSQTYLPLPTEPFRSKFARARLVWPATEKISVRSMAAGIGTTPVAVGAERELSIALPLAKPAEMPDDAPVRYRSLPLLEATSFTGWDDVAATMAPLYRTETLIADGSAIAQETDAIAKAQPDALHRAEAALELVQSKVRYLLMGMNGGNYVPQSPARTWELRYGDCKAKTLLLLSMLRRMGIESEAVLVSSQLGDMLPKRLPMPGAFDHVLVRASIDGKTYWLDGTGAGARIADIGDTPNLRYALPLRASGAALLPIVQSPRARADIAIASEIDDSAGLGLPSPYRTTILIRGGLAETMATVSTQANAEQKREMIGKLTNEFVGQGDLAEGDLSYDAKTGLATVTATGVIASRWEKDGKRYRFTLDQAVTKRQFAPDRARTAWRDIPIAVPSQGSMVIATRLTLPDGGRGFGLEGDRTLPATLGGVRVTRSAALDHGVATIEDRLDETGGEIVSADLPAARTAYAAAKNRMLKVVAPADYPARAAIVVAARSAGRLKPIEAAYAKAIAANPKEAGPYRTRADFRSGVYDRAGAIADWTKVIAISPDANAYANRSWLYESLGQNAKAIADAEAAYNFDEDDGVARLARLQVMYGKRVDGFALIEPRIEAAGKDRVDYMSQKADLLADIGEPDEALSVIDAALTERPGRADLLNTRCWIKGRAAKALDTALKDCTKAIELSDYPAGALDSRAMVYFRMGRMDDALADLDAALDAAPDLSASLFMRGVVLGKLGRQVEAGRDLAAARLIAPQVDADYKRYGITP
jgi:tetratricopeptide (TPR) repeat protein